MSAFLAERNVAIDAVLRASRVCQSVFRQLVTSEIITKGDKTPLTIADLSSQAVVNAMLQRSFPKDPIIGEEDASPLRDKGRSSLCATVLELANSGLDTPLNEEKLLEVIDRGNYPGGSQGRMWTLDPIDGTKGFLRGEQYAVCLALIVDGRVRLGVMGCPNLPVNRARPDGERGCLFIAVEGQGAFQRPFSASEETPIHMASIDDPSNATFCESVESSHSSHEDSALIASALGITNPPLRMDSQCKYCSIARGDAHIYMKLPVGNYVESIWDHTAGSLLVQEAGGTVTDVYGRQLDFTLGRKLGNTNCIIAAHQKIHAKVVKAVKSVILADRSE